MRLEEVIKQTIKQFQESSTKYIVLKHGCRFQREELEDEKQHLINNSEWDKEKYKYKYQKEEAVKAQLAEDYMELRDSRERRDNFYRNKELARFWKDFYMEMYKQKGDIEIPDNEVGQLPSVIEEE